MFLPFLLPLGKLIKDDKRPHGCLRVALDRGGGSRRCLLADGSSLQTKAAVNGQSTPCLANSQEPWGDASHGGISACPCPILAG